MAFPARVNPKFIDRSFPKRADIQLTSASFLPCLLEDLSFVHNTLSAARFSLPGIPDFTGQPDLENTKPAAHFVDPKLRLGSPLAR
jgi:hypothetical protein